ncbi:MAG: tetratricopeptide repeat protein [Phycisphaerales bacterium]|nr:tetratricopeptide repeat protein [Phycisphaerales bacterium]
MPSAKPNLPLLLAAGAAAGSMALLAGVIAWRSRLADGAEPPQPPKPAGARTTTPGPDPITTVLNAADTLVRQGEADRAEAVLRAAVAEHAGSQELRLALAGACILQQKLPEAYEQYEAALAIGPRAAETEFNAGTLAAQLKRLDRAEEHFAAAQATDPSDPRYPLYLAQIQIALNQPEQARRNLLLATRLDENLAVAWGTLAELSLRANEPNVALQLAARARALEPAVAAWRVIEARALNRTGKPEEALAVLGGISDAERRQLPILRLIGECYGMLRRPAEAAREFEAAAASSPATADLLLDTAIWCERAGDAAKALAYARRAADLGSEPAKQMAARLTNQ